MVTFEVRKPSYHEICEAYQLCYPDRICYLRPDSLGYLLQMANISSESKVLIVENTKGFIPGVLMERQIKYGLRVEFCNRSIKYNTDILHEMDVPPAWQSKVGAINANMILNDPMSAMVKA